MARIDRELLNLPQFPELPELQKLPEFPELPELVAGVDEVGRGALFGEVVAAAVILPATAIEPLTSLGVRDSKKLSPQKRQKLAIAIQAHALDWQIATATVAEIDQINILQATLLAMYRAVTNLKITPQHCLVDGNQLIPDLNLPQTAMIKGDATSLVIGAASIVAKVWRDRRITELALTYPHYDLENNKGYGTPKHLTALRQYGSSPLHRQSFNLGIPPSLDVPTL